MVDDQKIINGFQSLYDDPNIENLFPANRPLLTHYTSIEIFESIARSDEVWFSNPLFMNDLEELRFGVLEGSQQFLANDVIKRACGSAERTLILSNAFQRHFDQFANEHALDVYVFCLSEHSAGDSDGLLSMWRGYGGNGKGVAIVFDTNKLDSLPRSALILSRVVYASAEERRQWLDEKLKEFAALLEKLNLPDEKLPLAAWVMFDRIRLFALFTKHRGFSEEKEWRVVYAKERDLEKKLDAMMGYVVGNRGVEPRLKFKIAPIEGYTAGDLSLNKIIHQIILGPSTSSPLARMAFLRMLDSIGKSDLKARVRASGIPFRAT